MKLDDVIELMSKCGLDEKESRAFVHLTKLGESKVTDLANAAGLKRAETYQILERLQGRGLVEGTLARPRTFIATPPKHAMQLLIEERERDLTRLEGLREDAARRLSSLAGAATEASTGSYRILQDLNQIMGQLHRTVREAKREICVVSSSRSLFRLLDEGLEGDLRAAHAQGVTVRVLTEVLPGQEADARRLMEYSQARHLIVPRPLRFLLTDESEIVQYVTADALTGGARETALWIGASDHVQAQRATFDDMWWSGIDAGARLDELRTGQPAPQAQLVRGRFTRIEKTKEMLVRAKSDVLAELTPTEVAIFEKSGLRRAYEACAAQGATVRILAPEGAPVIAKGVDVRTHAHGEATLASLVVDDHEALLVLPGEAAPSSGVTALEEYALWVTMAPPVAAMHARLRDAWDRAA